MGVKGAFFGFGSTSIRSTIVTGQTEGLKVGCGGMVYGWLSRFTVIRLRRISLATLPRYGRALSIGWIPIYILPASGRWSHSLPR